ncbi:MAG: CoA transferase [Candidatus Rokubacteria bacterium]|nr:CoA transferase [Candidatus Rokubacteria bacterium]
MANKRGPGTVASACLNRPSDTLAETHWWERGVFEKIEDPDYGELLLQAPPWKMSRTPPRIMGVPAGGGGQRDGVPEVPGPGPGAASGPEGRGCDLACGTGNRRRTRWASNW